MALVAIPASGPAGAQIVASDPHFLAPAAIISKRVDEVNLVFTVTDKRAHFVSNLHVDDLRLLDGDRPPRRITLFEQRSNLPLHLAILIDASASVKYRYQQEQQAALAFVKRILRPTTDRGFVVAFNDSVTTIQDLSGGDLSRKISRALAKVNVDGNTALYDAVIYASARLRKIAEKGITRRAVVIVSDGVDTVHRATLEKAKEAAARDDVMIFALTTNFSELDPNGEGDAVLRELATSTGGALLPAQDETRLYAAFHNVEKALRSQYVLAYTPADFRADGEYRTVEITARKRGLRTNCRKGYYAKAGP
jgi:VWFA-related protein